MSGSVATLTRPSIAEGSADLVVALEIHEAVSGSRAYLREGGTLVWFDASWQPLQVRLGQARAATEADVEEAAALRGARVVRVGQEAVTDPRMQNVAVLAAICRQGLVPGLKLEHVRSALSDLMSGPALTANLALLAD